MTKDDIKVFAAVSEKPGSCNCFRAGVEIGAKIAPTVLEWKLEPRMLPLEMMRMDLFADEAEDDKKAAEEREASTKKKEIERQFSAIRAVRDVEIEHLLTAIRLLRSYFKKEQLQTPTLQFFNENFPSLSVVRNETNGQFEMQWNNRDGNLSKDYANGGDIHASLLHHMSVAYPDYSAAIPSFANYELSNKTVKTSLRDAGCMQIKDFVLEEPFDTQMLGAQDSLQTPGVSSQKMSIGMIPRTRRLPKNGEMLIYVHGSPLGVYKENDMEAIHESEER